MHMDVHSSRSPVLTGPLPLPLCATQRRSHMQLAAAIPLKRSAYWQSGVLPWEAVRHICVSLPPPPHANAKYSFLRKYRGFIFGCIPNPVPGEALNLAYARKKKPKHEKRRKKKEMLACY